MACVHVNCSKKTAQWAAEKNRAVKEMIVHTADYVREVLPSIYSWELVEQTFIQPYCRIGNLVDEDIAHRETASKYLKELSGIAVLEEVKVGREKLFVHPKFLHLLTTDSNAFTQYKLLQGTQRN